MIMPLGVSGGRKRTSMEEAVRAVRVSGGTSEGAVKREREEGVRGKKEGREREKGREEERRKEKGKCWKASGRYKMKDKGGSMHTIDTVISLTPILKTWTRE